MKQCKFNSSVKCGYVSEDFCVRCPERLKVGQTMLVPEKTVPKTTVTVEVDTTVTCPFCLYTDDITRFMIRLKSGKHSEKRFQCPDCKQKMLKETLTKKMTVEEYAEWVHDLGGRYFWSRCQFSKFKQRLKDLGISRQFWDAYRKLKEEKGETETYEEYLERKQREEMEEYDSGDY